MHHLRPQSPCSFVYDGAKLSLIDVTARDVRHSLIVALLSHAANSDSKCMLEACVDLDGPSSGQNSQPLCRVQPEQKSAVQEHRFASPQATGVGELERVRKSYQREMCNCG